MKKLFLCICVFFCAHLTYPQAQPIVVVDNIALLHQERGWRVIDVSASPIHLNLIKGDLIVRIDGKNASETGPMVMTSLLNEGNRNSIKLFIERGNSPMETQLRDISAQDLDPVGANPFRRVATGFSVPDAELADIDGRPLSLEQFQGKWLLIDFMATWCAPCSEALPNILGIVDRHKLSLLTVAINDRRDAVRRMQQKYKISSPIIMTKIMSQLPIDFGVTTNRWTGQVPALVLIRPDGDVAFIELGCFDTARFENVIQGLMNSNEDEVVKDLKCSCER